MDRARPILCHVIGHMEAVSSRGHGRSTLKDLTPFEFRPLSKIEHFCTNGTCKTFLSSSTELNATILRLPPKFAPNQWQGFLWPRSRRRHFHDETSGFVENWRYGPTKRRLARPNVA
jgi:hypothetical protein